MMKIYFEPEEIIPTDESEIRDLEKRISTRLPEDFRTYLLAYNGARLRIEGYEGHPMVRVQWQPGQAAKHSGDEQLLHQPNALVRDWSQWSMNQHSDIRYFLQEIPYRVQLGCIPIWCDPGGNLFLLGVRGKLSGKVFYSNRDYHRYDESGERPNFDNVAFVANSFTEFIQMIEPEPQDWDLWEAAGKPRLPLSTEELEALAQERAQTLKPPEKPQTPNFAAENVRASRKANGDEKSAGE